MALILPNALCLASLTLMGETDAEKEIVFSGSGTLGNKTKVKGLGERKGLTDVQNSTAE